MEYIPFDVHKHYAWQRQRTNVADSNGKKNSPMPWLAAGIPQRL